MSDSNVLSTEKRGHLFLMGLNRTDKRNAFNLALIRALSAAYTELSNNPDLWCGVVFAHGDHFTGGLDLADVAPLLMTGASPIDDDAVDPWGINGARCTKPVVLAVQGTCLTAGIELALAADITVAAESTRFAQIEVQRGIMPLGGATFRFPQVAGWGNAMRYILTGDKFDAAEALRLGVIQEIAEDGAQRRRAIEIAETIAAQAPLAVQATLANARRAMLEGIPAATAEFPEVIQRLAATEDATEGMASFMERRPPKFQGKYRAGDHLRSFAAT